MSPINVRRAIATLVFALAFVFGALLSNAYFASLMKAPITVYLSLIASATVIIIIRPLWRVLFPGKRIGR